MFIGSGVYGYYRYKNKDKILFDKVVKYLVNNKKDDTNMDNYITSKKFNAGIFAFLINNIENEIQNEGKKIKGGLYDYVNKTRCISNIEECDQENLNIILKKVNIKNLRKLYKYNFTYDKCIFNYASYFNKNLKHNELEPFTIYVTKIILEIPIN